MLVRIVMCALVAGGIAGATSALLQQALVIPVLLEAELYESGKAVHFGAKGGAAGSGHANAGSPDGADLKRHLVTAVMTIGINVGFALLLIAAFFARDARPNLRHGLVWGAAGFAAFMLAPAAGLAPELPGVAAAGLEQRQLWWLLTVIATATALWLIAFHEVSWSIPVAIVLIVVPHLVGAPTTDAFTGPAPPELAAEFAARALAVGFVSWTVLGGAAALVWRRQNPEEG